MIKWIACFFLALGGGAFAFGFMMCPQYGEWIGIGWALIVAGILGLWLSHDPNNDGGTYV